MKKTGIAIHGGAGTILKSQMSPELEQNYLNGLMDPPKDIILNSSLIEVGYFI